MTVNQQLSLEGELHDNEPKTSVSTYSVKT